MGVLSIALSTLAARYVSSKRVNYTRASANAAGRLYSTTVNGMEMIETIKAAGAEATFFNRWSGYQAANYDIQAKMTLVNEYVGTIPQAITKLANIIVLVMGIWLIVKGDFTPGVLLAFTGFLSSFMAPVNQMIGLASSNVRCVACLPRHRRGYSSAAKRLIRLLLHGSHDGTRGEGDGFRCKARSRRGSSVLQALACQVAYGARSARVYLWIA